MSRVSHGRDLRQLHDAVYWVFALILYLSSEEVLAPRLAVALRAFMRDATTAKPVIALVPDCPQKEKAWNKSMPL